MSEQGAPDERLVNAIGEGLAEISQRREEARALAWCLAFALSLVMLADRIRARTRSRAGMWTMNGKFDPTTAIFWLLWWAGIWFYGFFALIRDVASWLAHQ